MGIIKDKNEGKIKICIYYAGMNSACVIDTAKKQLFAYDRDHSGETAGEYLFYIKGKKVSRTKYEKYMHKIKTLYSAEQSFDNIVRWVPVVQ